MQFEASGDYLHISRRVSGVFLSRLELQYSPSFFQNTDMTSLVQTSLSSNLKHDKRPDYSTPPRSIPRLAGLWQAMRRHYPPSTSAISTSKSTITCAGFPLKNCRRILTKTTCDKTFTLRLLNRCPTSIRIYRRKILFKTG